MPNTTIANELTEREFLDSLFYIRPCECEKQGYSQGRSCAWHPTVYSGFISEVVSGACHISSIHRHTAETATYYIRSSRDPLKLFFQSKDYQSYLKELQTITNMSEAEYYETF